MQEAWDDVDDGLILAIISGAALAGCYRELARERPHGRVNFTAAADKHSERVKALADEVVERDARYAGAPPVTRP